MSIKYTEQEDTYLLYSNCEDLMRKHDYAMEFHSLIMSQRQIEHTDSLSTTITTTATILHSPKMILFFQFSSW